jgi:hypothetical protein
LRQPRSAVIEPKKNTSAVENFIAQRNSMKLIASFVCLTLAVVQLLGCQKSARFDPALAGSFFPLRPGLTWTYRVIDKGQETPQIFTDRAMGGQERVGTANASSGVVAEYSGSDGASDLTIFYAVEDGYVTRSLGLGDAKHIMSQEREFLPSLLKPDLTWSNTQSPIGHFAEGFHVTQTHRTSLESAVVIVPAGHFSNCIRIETDALLRDDLSPRTPGTRELKYVDWYAPNVGLIKTTVKESGFFGAQTGSVELLSFSDSGAKAADASLSQR